MAEPQTFDPSKPFSIVDAPPPAPPQSVLQRMTAGMVDPRTVPRDQRPDPFVVHGLTPNAEAAVNRPLVHLTGIDAIDDLTSPVNLALTATLGARSAGKALGAAAEAISAGVDSELVAKTLKFLTPTKFREGLDLLTSMAKKAASTSPTASAPVPAAPASPAAVSPAAGAPVAAAPAPAAPPVPPVAPPSLQSGSGGPSPAAQALPDQRALNEAALAARRAAYQARMQSAPPPVESPAPVAGNVKLSAAEAKAFLDLMQRGMSGPEAMKNVLMQRELVATLGTPTPTAAQTRFPKGMRSKASQP